MPATTARKGSAAYEKGIREGQAMASRARRSTAPEPEETEEEGEEEEMDMASTNRKRSAKGAKNTKAPMDGAYGKKPMDAECGCSGKKGGKCDGSCGGAMRKRGDAALTPHEYLGACDLGIQDRSRSYIRARLDAAERLDLKCGNGAISEGEKCTKGAAQKVQGPAQKAKGIASTAAILGGLAINAGAAGVALGKGFSGDFAGAGRAFQVAGGGQALMATGARGLGLKKEANKLISGAAITAGLGTVQRELATGEIQGAMGRARIGKRLRYAPGNAIGRARIAAMKRRPMPKPKMKDGKIANPWLDSVYADGFAPDLYQLTI